MKERHGKNRPGGEAAADAAERLAEHEILKRIAAGEHAMFEVLVRRHRRRVRRVIAAILRNATDVEDATQETFAEAYAGLRGFNGASSFSTWLTRIAIHTALRQVRGARRRAVVETSTPSHTAGETPEDHIIGQDVLRLAQEAVARLRPAYLAVFTLRDIEHLSTSETAARLGLTERVVKVRLHRARRMLRRALHVGMRRLAPRVFPFRAPRCDRIVAGAMARIADGDDVAERPNFAADGGNPTPLRIPVPSGTRTALEGTMNSVFALARAASLVLLWIGLQACSAARPATAADMSAAAANGPAASNAAMLLGQGKQIFRFDTFGDEAFWGDALKLHQAIEGAANGGVGPGVPPRTALSVGLKVDVDALPDDLRQAFAQGKVNLDDPATTLALLKLNAVVGVTGLFNSDGKTLQSVGIQCALCHSTVDDSLAAGIGHRLDGWANRDLNVGAIVGLAPNLQPIADLLSKGGTPVDVATVKKVLAGWGPGRFDAELVLDGKGFRPDWKTASVLIPPAFGLAGLNLHTWTGWGSVTHWNAFVANLEMHGKGTFFDPRLDDAARFPVAAAAGLGHVRNDPDLITPKLAALHFYQLALPTPKPPTDSFDHAAAERGKKLFQGQARCNSCHVPPLFTEPGWNLHAPAEIGVDDFQANRAPDRRYRTAPLSGLFSHAKGGFYHDGRFGTLPEVVDHYNALFGLGLTPAQEADLVEYLKSL